MEMKHPCNPSLKIQTLKTKKNTCILLLAFCLYAKIFSNCVVLMNLITHSQLDWRLMEIFQVKVAIKSKDTARPDMQLLNMGGQSTAVKCPSLSNSVRWLYGMRKLSTRERGTGFQRGTEWARAAAIHAREPEFKF